MIKQVHLTVKCHLKIITIFLAFFYISPSFAVNSDKLTKNQKKFLFAYDAIKSNDRPLISLYKKRLKSYNLLPFLNYYDIIYNFETTPASQINRYLRNKDNRLLKSKLIHNYLKYLGKEKKHQQFLQHFQPETHTNQTLQCYAYLAKFKTGKADKKTLKLAKNLWKNQLYVSKNCRGLDQYLKQNKKITAAMIWQRIIKNMHAGRLSKAKKLSSNLSTKDKKNVRFWIKAYKKPLLALEKNMPSFVAPTIRKNIFKQAIHRYSYSNPQKSIQLLKLKSEQYGLSKNETIKLKQKFSLRLAYKYHPKAESYLATLKTATTDKDVLRWRLQLTIRESNWLTYLDLYELLPADKQQDKRWRYWKARSYEALNRKKQAHEIYQSLAKSRSYYGFLAADKLGLQYKFNHVKSNHYSTDDLLKKYPQLGLMQELIAIDWQTNLRRVWGDLLRKADKKDIEAIANYLSTLNQHTFAIQTIAKVKKWNDLSLRFPTPYKNLIKKTAQKDNIDPAWVYGVIRRESAFSTTVQSSAGAIGLMQLMPATAKYIGKKIGFNQTQKLHLKTAKPNIKLGSAYLNYLSDKFDGNKVLATAAYNAGPHRVDRWLPKNKSMAADQWIDTITFTETRDYVKAVLEYSIIFQSKLDQRYDTLKNLMPAIPAKKIGKKKVLVRLSKT